MVEGQPSTAHCAQRLSFHSDGAPSDDCRAASSGLSPITSVNHVSSASRTQRGGAATTRPLSDVGIGGRGSSSSPVPHGSPHTPSMASRHHVPSEYLINRLIRDIKDGVSPSPVAADTAAAFAVGGNAAAPARTPPRQSVDPTPVNRTPTRGGGRGECSQSPSGAVREVGTSPAAGPQGQQGRALALEKNKDRWGEDETAWLCRFRNEVKLQMNEDTEAYGRAWLKANFWKNVELRMKEKGYNRDHEQCKNKFNQVIEYYRRLKCHERWSRLPSYWDMNSTEKKKYNVDFVLRRSWYDIIDSVEKDTDSINLTYLRDSGDDPRRHTETDDMADADGQTEGVSDDLGRGSGAASGGTRSTTFESTLGKRKRAVSNAREASVQAVTSAMRDHTTSLTRSDRECAKMRCETTPDVKKQQAELATQLMQQELAGRERVASIVGGRVESGMNRLADAIVMNGMNRLADAIVMMASRRRSHSPNDPTRDDSE
ncbi:hypothetical protein CBR_g20382 [Chara braunii]|uniref:Myb/SANT-like DNA-binding domain-containing protein n=1 Tax=Chara braunii TaxID=69332 RepID=A0A388JU58_CHABU|nr:hypothetical protein CBR_g20382 [Chara braunii]|eukprot:GBG61349.1 hypothetical protein CBR_g20382 [Chara braunii]